MSQITTGRVRKWATLSMTVVLVISLITWYWQCDRIPTHIRIATAAKRGLYYRVGYTIGESLKGRVSSSIEVVETDGADLG